MDRYVLFPGRHHLLTRFQAEYLRKAAGDGATVVWAVTSANHENTRRNPVPYDRREAAIERFSLAEGLRSLVVPVFDTAYTDRFAHDAAPARPWDVLLRLAAGDPSWRKLAHPAAHVGSLSTRARLDQFAADYRFPLPFAVRADGAVELSLADAMDFLTRKDYVDNWLSECHEQFCGLEYADWKGLLADVGFEVDPVSRAWRNDWIVAHRLAPVASLSTVDGATLPWPATHVLLVVRRPLNT